MYKIFDEFYSSSSNQSLTGTFTGYELAIKDESGSNLIKTVMRKASVDDIFDESGKVQTLTRSYEFKVGYELLPGQVIHPGLIKDERTGLITIQKGTKYFATSTNDASEQIGTVPDSSSFFFHPQSQLIYPIKGNVLYNTDSNRFVVTVDTGVAFSEEKESEFIPFIPYPENDMKINYLTIESQSDLKYANRLVDKESGVAVPILAVTIHPASGVLYPLGGTFVSEITNLITPIELGLIHSENNFENDEKYRKSVLTYNILVSLGDI